MSTKYIENSTKYLETRKFALLSQKPWLSTSKFRLLNVKFRHNISQFRLINKRFRLSIWISIYYVKHSTKYLGNSTSYLEILT